MTHRRRLVTAILLSTLLHAMAALLLATVSDRSREPALTVKGSRIKATVVSVAHAPSQGTTTISKAPPVGESALGTDAIRAGNKRNTSGVTRPEIPTTSSAQNPDVFLPQEYLTRQPRPESELSLEDIAQPEQSGVFQMRVWIDHRGKPTHIEADDTTAPAQFVEQIAERFSAARFHPGERHGLPVACIIRIEISY